MWRKLFKKNHSKSRRRRVSDVELEDIEEREEHRLINSNYSTDGTTSSILAHLRYPWNEMVLWVLTTLTQQQLRREYGFQNSNEIERNVTLLLQDYQTFLDIEIEDLFGDDWEFNDQSKFVTWAQVLLRNCKTLQQARYKLVPRRMNESDFWKHYFLVVRNVIIHFIKDPQNKEDLPTVPPPQTA